MPGSFGINAQSQITQPFGGLAANCVRGGFEGNIFVVPGFGFTCGGEDRLRQTVAFAESRGQGDAADGAGAFVVLPA